MVRVLSEDAASHIVAALSKRLAQERENRGVSKKRLAAAAGFNRSTVRFIEDPDDNPTIYNLVRYALALEVDVGKILSECLDAHWEEKNAQTTSRSKKAKA